MAKQRSKNAILNIIVGIIVQIVILLLSFFERAIFVRYLDADYLGINGLFSNILSVLALAELGLGNVTQFFLYKPVENNDQGKIKALVKYFQKLYFIIAAVILGLGLLMIPLLKFIINSELPQSDMIVYYVLFLTNSVVSYFGAHKIALFAANQDNRMQKYVMLATSILTQTLHIIVLHFWQNYMVYIGATISCTLINVVLINLIGEKKYPYLHDKSIVKKDINKKQIIYNIKSTFIYKIGATIVNNTDNILISIIVSTAAVGLYSNYYMVVNAVQALMAIITTSLISAVGNLCATGNKKRMNTVFNAMLLGYHSIAIFGAISFYFLFADLIPLWVGEQFLLDKLSVFAIAISFYVTTAISPIWMFREANGLFGKVKYLLLITAIVNIILSIPMGIYWGMGGILLSTVVARIVTQVWYEPRILYKNVFDVSQKSYWCREAWYLLLSIIAFFPCYFIDKYMPHGFGWMILKAFIFLGITGIVFLLGNIKSQELKTLISMLMNGFGIKRSINKNKKEVAIIDAESVVEEVQTTNEEPNQEDKIEPIDDSKDKEDK